MEFSTPENLVKSLREHAKRCEKINTGYIPEGPIKFLIIGESPPADGTYFYIPKKLKKNSKTIPGQVFRAVFDINREVAEDEYEQCLNNLQSKYKLYLVDLCSYPINCFTTKYRIRFILSEFENFIKIYEKLWLDANAQKILVLPSNTIKELKKSEYHILFRKIQSALNIEEDAICKFRQLERKL